MVGLQPVIVPVLTAIIFTAAAVAVLIVARQWDARWPMATLALIAAFMAVDLRWNNAPHNSTALPRERFDALRQGTANATVIMGGGAETISSGSKDLGAHISGGTQFVSSGGTASSTVINGGLMVLETGGVVSGGIVFSGAGTVEIWDTGQASSPGQPAVFAHWPARTGGEDLAECAPA